MLFSASHMSSCFHQDGLRDVLQYDPRCSKRPLTASSYIATQSGFATHAFLASSNVVDRPPNALRPQAPSKIVQLSCATVDGVGDGVSDDNGDDGGDFGSGSDD